MAADYLVLRVVYDVKKDKFTSSGDLNEDGKREVIESFLRSQMGAGADRREYIKRRKYEIELRWFPEDDNIEVISNTGNKGLRDGLLLKFFKDLK